MDIVRRGHYCSKATLNSEVKDIIRILGPDKNRTGYYITQDGTSISEYALDNYVYLDTVPDGEKVSTDKKRNIMADFAPTEQKPNTLEYQEEIETYQEEVVETVIKKPVKHIISEEDKKLFEIQQLIEKANIHKLNDYQDKKFGTRPYKPSNISITINVEIPYDIKKLSQICELFEIEYRDISKLIVKNIQLPNEFIQQKIENALRGSEILEESNENHIQTSQSNNKPKPIEYQENIETLNSGIQEVDNYLTDFFNGK